ncbi:hypothetical protein HYU14_05055 [Candidatus Woesearchaeota archaeon]|nr:hypothetical protein [Candidatus Woesearchaeota archaeon]
MRGKGAKKRGKSGKLPNLFRNKKITAIFGFLALLFIISLAANKKQGFQAGSGVTQDGIPAKDIDQDARLLLDVAGDFSNKDAGTFIIKVKVDMGRIVEQFQKIPRYLVFFESKAVPSLILRYDLWNSVIEGGSPMLRTEPVRFLDGSYHEITYTFRVGRSQAIYFDGKKMKQDIFLPGENFITGTAVRDPRSYVLGKFAVDGNAAFNSSFLK